MSLSPDRWRIIRGVFADLAELSGPERERRLAEITFNDPGLRTEIEALLVAADQVGDRFERAPMLDDDGDQPSVAIGERVGPYRVIREIGQGGMGTVYEAHRDEGGFHKRVALKMVARGRDSDAILRRFRYERQILARLEHRNIAALLDGGLTESGQPYFAMEYVEGERIDHYCRDRRLGVRDRLQLFRQVCSAVHYAHQNLVVHRDLKPSNILVGSDGTVKLLDFGIAKLLDPDEADDQLTQTGLTPMTTAYASPEQLAGDPVTTASDIYSLGVLLYEILAGRGPFPTGDVPVLEIRRRRLESLPLPPSRAVTAEMASLHSEPTARRLQRVLEGELDNIVLMALRKEPERRYPTVESMSDDLLRFLAGLPIQATPDSLGYRVGRMIRRNRLAVAAASLAIVAVLAGAAASLWQAGIARAERDRAEHERQKAEQVTEFFRSVFLAASPLKLGRDVTVVEAIDAAVPRIDSAFAGPDRLWLKTALQSTLSTTFFEMGLPVKALPLAEAALRARATLDSGRVTLDGANQVYDLAGVEYSLGHLVRAESLFRRSVAMYEALPGFDPTELARVWGQVAMLAGSQGRHAEAIDIQKRTIDLLRARVPPTDRSLRVALINYGADLTEVGRLSEGERSLREAALLVETTVGASHDDMAAALQPLAVNLMYAGNLAAAESVARRAHGILVRSRGPDNTATLVALRALMNVLVEQNRCQDAMGLARGVIALRERGLPETDLSLGSAYLVLGECLGRNGQARDGVVAVREALRLRLAVLPPTHWAVAYGRSVLGEVLVRAGKVVEGRALLDQAYHEMTTALGPDNPRSRQARARQERWGLAS